MKNQKLEMWVGIFMLLGVAALAMLALKVSGTGGSSSNTYRIEARFDNVGGLSVKAPVMIGGVRVGRVGDIWIDKEDYVAVVGMDIETQYDTLPDDTGASILTAGLLGAQFVGLSPGFSDFYLKKGMLWNLPSLRFNSSLSSANLCLIRVTARMKNDL